MKIVCQYYRVFQEEDKSGWGFDGFCVGAKEAPSVICHGNTTKCQEYIPTQKPEQKPSKKLFGDK